MNKDDALLVVRDLRFAHGARAAPAVDGVSLQVRAGETLGLVGESGCGKTTLARLVVGLLQPAHGTVALAGQPLTRTGAAARLAQARLVQMVFQDPFGSLNPRLRIGTIVAEPLAVHGLGDRASRRGTAAELLERVGLGARTAERFPHELSGGQRQRVAIARALALRPRLIVCDEPVSALDVSIQAQVLNLLRDLQAEFGLAYLFISHDLRVVRYIADRTAVMYRGRIVETGPSDRIWATPRHPYSQALLASLPKEPRDAAEHELPDMAPEPVPGAAVSVAGGCRYRDICPIRVAQCDTAEPQLLPAHEPHQAACWRQ